MTSTISRLAAVGATTAVTLGALLAPALSAPASAASDKGLFGSQDPTYDGVYRQGLALTGLAAADAKAPGSAVRWLLGQQCGNGSFTSYRADLSVPCAKPDPASYSGQDTNATAMAAMALVTVDRKAEAKAALKYLLKQQNDDGGFPWFRGGDSDTNSTGLVLAAANSFAKTSATKAQAKSARKFLKAAQLRCDAPSKSRGLLQFQLGLGTSDSLGTAQAAVGMLTTLPAGSHPQQGAKISCQGGEQTGDVKVDAATLHALARTLKANGGLLPNSFGKGADVSASIGAVIALASAQWKPGVVRNAVAALQDATAKYTKTDGEINAGASGALLLATGITGSNPRDFGGVNLVKRLKASQR